MARRPIRGSATKQDTGKSCPFCRFPIKERDEVVACGECHSTHHEDCWEENGGCAVPGCAGGPDASSSTGGSGGSHIPPKAGPSKKKVTMDPRPAMRRRKRERQRKKTTRTPASAAPSGNSSKSTLWIVGAAVAFLAVIGVIMVANNFGDTGPANAKSCEEGTGANGIPCYDNGKLPNIPSSEMENQAGRSLRSWFNLISLGNYQQAWMRLSPRARKYINQDKGYQGWKESQLKLTKYLEPANAVVKIVRPNYPDSGVLSLRITNMPYTKPGDLCEKREGVTWMVWDPKKNKWFYEPGMSLTKERKSDWAYRSNELLRYNCK